MPRPSGPLTIPGLRASGMATFALMVALAGPGAAQERGPPERVALSQLAYTLGEAHALHRLCVGRRDGLWWSRMRRLIEVERPDEGLRRRLTEAFNAGYLAGRAEFPGCGEGSRTAERDTAARGEALARGLAR